MRTGIVKINVAEESVRIQTQTGENDRNELSMPRVASLSSQARDLMVSARTWGSRTWIATFFLSFLLKGK